MDLGLTGRVAIVTGASRGIGRAIAHRLCAEKARVCMVSRRPDVLEAAGAEIAAQTGGEILVFPGDVADAALPGKAVAAVLARWNRIDILVNNAGGPPPGSFLLQSEETWALALQQNFLSCVRFCETVAPLMKKASWGRIVNIASTVAREPEPSMVLSSSARAAVLAFSKAIARELAPDNITVNTICPGSVETERAVSLLMAAARAENRPYPEVKARSEASVPIGRFASADEIADVALYLASERSRYITGTAIVVDGGLTKGLF
jgi:3-oxoacyl-[acyl-carrier protein] reductase